MDPVLMYIAAMHYALAITAGIWAYHVRKRDHSVPSLTVTIAPIGASVHQPHQAQRS
jgi:thiamine monophosphate synthase